MLYMISYDLMSPGQTYDKMHKRISALNGTRVLLSQWVIPYVSTLMTPAPTANQLWSDLRQYVDTNDRLWVTELTQNMEWSTERLLVSNAEMQRLRDFARL